MRDGMKKGDLVFFYHSNAEPSGIAGIAEVSKPAYPDPAQFDAKSEYYDEKATKEKPIWYVVEIKFVEKLPAVIPLEKLKKIKALGDMPLLARGQRLSVQPVSEQQWKAILSTPQRV